MNKPATPNDGHFGTREEVIERYKAMKAEWSARDEECKTLDDKLATAKANLIATQKELEAADKQAQYLLDEQVKMVRQQMDRAEKAEQALAEAKEENERLTNWLAADGRAFDLVIGCCYDELKKALGRDIECPAYIPDAIRELAALALRGEPVAWMMVYEGANSGVVETSEMLALSKMAQSGLRGELVPLYRHAPVSGEPVMWGISTNGKVYNAEYHKAFAEKRIADWTAMNSKFYPSRYELVPLYAAPISGEPETRQLADVVIEMKLVPPGTMVPLELLEVADRYWRAVMKVAQQGER